MDDLLSYDVGAPAAAFLSLMPSSLSSSLALSDEVVEAASAYPAEALGKALAMLPLYEILRLDPFDTEGLEHDLVLPAAGAQPYGTAPPAAPAQQRSQGAPAEVKPPPQQQRGAPEPGSERSAAQAQRSGRSAAPAAQPAVRGDDDGLDDLLSAGPAAPVQSGAPAAAAAARGRLQTAAMAATPVAAVAPPKPPAAAAAVDEDDSWLDELLSKK